MLADYHSAYTNEQRPYVEKLSKIAAEYNKGVKDPIVEARWRSWPNRQTSTQMWRFLVNITKDYDTYKETSSKHDELLTTC